MKAFLLEFSAYLAPIFVLVVVWLIRKLKRKLIDVPRYKNWKKGLKQQGYDDDEMGEICDLKGADEDELVVKGHLINVNLWIIIPIEWRKYMANRRKGYFHKSETEEIPTMEEMIQQETDGTKLPEIDRGTSLDIPEVE